MTVGNEEAVFAASTAKASPLLLKGPTGCGKTRFVEAMAHDLGPTTHNVSCHDDLTAADWLVATCSRAATRSGSMGLSLVRYARAPSATSTKWSRRARTPPSSSIRSLTTGASCPSTGWGRPRRGRWIRPGVSYNPGYQSVLKDLKDSTRQRMVAMELDFPPTAIEEKIVSHEAEDRP